MKPPAMIHLTPGERVLLLTRRSDRFELLGHLPENGTAKDGVPFILVRYARRQMTLD